MGAEVQGLATGSGCKWVVVDCKGVCGGVVSARGGVNWHREVLEMSRKVCVKAGGLVSAFGRQGVESV